MYVRGLYRCDPDTHPNSVLSYPEIFLACTLGVDEERKRGIKNNFEITSQRKIKRSENSRCDIRNIIKRNSQ